MRYTSLDTRATQCQLPSVVKELRPNQQFPVETSPLQAEREFSLEPNPRKIKNPATSAGQIRPFLRGRLSAPLERMYSKLAVRLPGVRNQSHLKMSRQTRNVRRHEQIQRSCRLPGSISKVWMESSDGAKIFTAFSCGIHEALWKEKPSFGFCRSFPHRFNLQTHLINGELRFPATIPTKVSVRFFLAPPRAILCNPITGDLWRSFPALV